MLRSDHRYQHSGVSLCRSLPNWIHTELAKIFTTAFCPNLTKINRNWKFFECSSLQDVKLAANVSANSRYVRGRHLYQTFHITFSCDRLQTVTSTHEGRWWTCYKPTRLFCVDRNHVCLSVMFPDADQSISTPLWWERNRKFNPNKHKETFSFNQIVVLQERTEGTFPLRAASSNSGRSDVYILNVPVTATRQTWCVSINIWANCELRSIKRELITESVTSFVEHLNEQQEVVMHPALIHWVIKSRALVNHYLCIRC